MLLSMSMFNYVLNLMMNDLDLWQSKSNDLDLWQSNSNDLDLSVYFEYEDVF